jgi:hypothetical protein
VKLGQPNRFEYLWKEAGAPKYRGKRSQGCGMFSSTHTLNLERVWKIVKEDLPKLESEVLKLRKQLA